MNKVRNDTPYTAEQVNLYLTERGVEIRYGDLVMKVEADRLREARETVASIPQAMLSAVMLSITQTLRASLPAVRAATASKQTMDEFYADLLLWMALKETVS